MMDPSRRGSLVLLVVLCAGVFLTGLELMITAVALPSIIVDMARREGIPSVEAWTQLRRASWIVNGYLLIYVATMPLAGRLADLWGVRRLFLAALAAFTVGSLLAGAAPSLDLLIAARLIQALGGGALVPVATAAAAHLYAGHDRPRALGAIGSLTFLGMAAGPFAGAALLRSIHADSALAAAGITAGPLVDLLAPSWRWVFYVNVPIGIVALAFAWAASLGWETPRHPARIDLPGALVFTIGLGSGLVALTLIGSQPDASAFGLGTTGTIAILGGLAVLGIGLAMVGGLVRRDPFLEVRLFGAPEFASAALVSLLTGYALATAIVGAAVFVDRVLYGGPPEQQVVLGALAAATAVGALLSGFAVRHLSLRVVTLAGIGASAAGLAVMAGWSPSTTITAAAWAVGLFGLGFGLTVTPRSTAAVESAGRAAFGMASATVTVARMIGMAVGLAVLTAYGSTTIDRLTTQINASPEAYQEFLPQELLGRPLRDPLVVDALERWASGEAAGILVGLFLVAAVVVATAAIPAIALRRHRARMLAGGPTPPMTVDGGPRREDGEPGTTDGADDAQPTLAL
jgi:MFS family permease